MKYLLLPLLLFSCLSCKKSILVEAQDVAPIGLNYYLAFDITDVNYQNPDQQETTSVYSTQDIESQLTFRDYNDADRYIFYTIYRDIPEDSILLIGQLRFVLDESTPFAQEVFHIEFLLEEARSELSEQPDGSYTYNSHAVLAERLQNQNWGNNDNMFANNQLNMLLLSFPDANFEHLWTGNRTLTSNGFYFQHENLEFTDVEYRPASDEIVLTGNFSVHLKELSCGFYSFFAVDNAHFKALLQ